MIRIALAAAVLVLGAGVVAARGNGYLGGADHHGPLEVGNLGGLGAVLAPHEVLVLDYRVGSRHFNQFVAGPVCIAVSERRRRPACSI